MVGIGRLRRALLLALVPALLVPSYAAAATFTPTVTADGDNGACTPELCTLRDAFEAANASPGSVVAIPPGAICSAWASSAETRASP